jgi:Carboxypeptidase regulatory-like domain
MRKNNYVRFTGIGVMCLMLGYSVAQGQSSTLILKGNTVSPVTSTQPAATPAPAPATKKVTKTTTTTTTKTTTTTTPVKPAPVVKAKPKPAPPVVKAAPVAKKPVVVANKKQGKGPKQVDYIKRVQYVHNLVSKRFQQSAIDSISDINHEMLDSIRMEIGKHKDKDSVNFLQTALSNGVNDSLIIVTINNLINASNVSDVIKNTGAVKAYCIDLSTQAPMDSVKVSILSHDSLVTTSFSGNDGFCNITNLKPGEYSLSFTKNNYTPFSDRWVKVTADNVTYIEMPLTETPRFYIPRFSAQIWAMIVVGIISIFVLVYSIIRRLGRVA